ncbi:MAG: aldose 1-epimerase [Pseudomonadota bacterium]
MQKLVLSSGELYAEILPQFGAGLARLDWIAGGAALPVLRPYCGEEAPRPNQLACFLLLPWSNRMAGGFSYDGRHYAIAPNRAGDEFPIHGQGWQLPWTVAEASDSHAVLTLVQDDGAPFHYRGQIEYALQGGSLKVTLSVRNTGGCPLPYGLGLHPFMPRSAGVTLRALARELWMPGPKRLPSHTVAIPAAWSFNQSIGLPDDAIDHIFGGWDGKAAIAWPETGLALEIEADAGYYIVYAPPGGDFFCFEPVDHLINAHNMGPGHGLTPLAPGEILRRTFQFRVSA